MKEYKYQLVLTARQLKLYHTFQEYFTEKEKVSIEDKEIMAIAGINAVVSPANSYGWMDGGIDQVYVYSFGKQIEERVQAKIKQEYDGELEVGDAFVIETHHKPIKYLIVAPTMRIPGPVKGTQNAYMAMKAILNTAFEWNSKNEDKIIGIGCPGLGTGTGQIPYEEAAKQMHQAYIEYINEKE